MKNKSLSAPPFCILGYDQGNFYFLAKNRHKMIVLTLEDIANKENLLKIAPLEWWKDAFKGVNLASICNVLIQACYAQGVFSECELFQSLLQRQRQMGWFR